MRKKQTSDLDQSKFPPAKFTQLVLDIPRPTVAKHTDVTYNDNAGWDRCVEELEDASFALRGSYMYDDAELHAKLLRRLNGRRHFSCGILVDKQTYDTRGCIGELSRLTELKAACASIYNCSGNLIVARDIFGPNALAAYFRVKAIRSDGNVAYHVPANSTSNSRKNVECVTRYVGAPEKDLCKGLSASRVEEERS